MFWQQLLAESNMAVGIPIGIPMGIPIGMVIGTSSAHKKLTEQIQQAIQSGELVIQQRDGKPMSPEQWALWMQNHKPYGA